MIRDREQRDPFPLQVNSSAPAAGSASRSRRVRRSSSAVAASRTWNWMVWGAFIRFTLVNRAFGPGSEPGLGLPVEAA